MLNIVLPIAGRGSRFAKEGYTLPMPLIPIHGYPMIQVVTENLRPKCEHRFIYICKKEHIEKFDLENKLRSYTGEENTVIIPIDYMTEGQVCTVLVAKDYINNDDALMSANADQWVDIDINDYLGDMESRNLDGLIMTMKSDDPKWSFARTDKNGYVTETAEKIPISDDATVGIYNFRNGSDLVRAAEQMIREDVRVNGEFYTCPRYNYLIKERKKIGVFSVGKEYAGMYGLGIPKDLHWFECHGISDFLRDWKEIREK